MKPLLKDIIVEIITESPASTREISKAIANKSNGLYVGSSVRCCMARMLKNGDVVRVGTDDRGGAKFGLPPQAGTVVSEFDRLLTPLRQMRGV